MNIAVIPYKSSRGRGDRGKAGRERLGRQDNMKGWNRKGKGGRLLQASTLSQLLVRTPNTTLEGNRHVRDIRQYSGR